MWWLHEVEIHLVIGSAAAGMAAGIGLMAIVFFTTNKWKK